MHPYIRLTRLDKPTGIWLLLWPCWWGLMLAARDVPPLPLLGLFLAGAVVMRSAGCIFNDIVDRDFDRQVERTRARPLASGEVSLAEASVLLVLLLFVALDILVQLNRAVWLLALASLALVAAYPFMKRVTWWPQAFLGLAFNWGALMGWAAVRGGLGWPALLLYLGGIGWTLGYDTIYAHQDARDDRGIGVKSTALLWGDRSRRWIGGFYAVAIFFWALAGLACGSGVLYYAGVALAAAQFGWQVARVKLEDPSSCLHMFRSNTVTGWCLFGGLWADGMLAAVSQL